MPIPNMINIMTISNVIFTNMTVTKLTVTIRTVTNMTITNKTKNYYYRVSKKIGYPTNGVNLDIFKCSLNSFYGGLRQDVYYINGIWKRVDKLLK